MQRCLGDHVYLQQVWRPTSLADVYTRVSVATDSAGPVLSVFSAILSRLLISGISKFKRFYGVLVE